MNVLKNIFKDKANNVFGMIHVRPLPGTPLYDGNGVKRIVYAACKEAETYLKCGVDGLIVENMHDVPYVPARHITPETVATMTAICSAVRRTVSDCVPCGVQILAAANSEAIAVAQASGFQFVRAEGFVFGHVADEGYTDACAGRLLRYRESIGAREVCVFADVKKKHSSHAITQDVSLAETAKAAEFFMADGIVITGTATGQPAEPDHVTDMKRTVSIPVLVGSGVTADNVYRYEGADGFIVGSHFKKNGMWQNELDETAILKFMEHVKSM
ncbi:Membrane complex biogenesis protein, BtpA family,Ribulose-phosphate binding barrel [Cinara cedri]|uniref:Membrane complex biogenesis protein, BtpA family,Ribulose-phosphate binding barrel n=1 Tax=Cinara cedri TaxID=506608 RepID=A0A5E4N0Q4_9HEMI|nr:Membrane complex biogenesis protein, BtpA family,Ribulose-phosphate binding barrel [Cinara cedri]